VLARRRLVEAWRNDPSQGRTTGFAVWHALLRYPTRIALLIVLVYALGGFTLIKMIWAP